MIETDCACCGQEMDIESRLARLEEALVALAGILAVEVALESDYMQFLSTEDREWFQQQIQDPSSDPSPDQGNKPS